MTRRAILAFAMLMAFSQAATAGVPLFGHVSCAMVRFYVARYSAVAAEKWARSHGASDNEIETARHCLHIETASLPAKSQVPAPVTEQERDRHEPAKSNSGQDTLHAVPDQGQHSDPERANQEMGIQDPIRPKDIENGPSRPGDTENGASTQVSTATTVITPADAKTPALPPRHIAAMHRAGVAAGHASWFKRLWIHLTSAATLKFRSVVPHTRHWNFKVKAALESKIC